MSKTKAEIAVIPIAIILIGSFLWYEYLSRPEPEPEKLEVPDFASIKDVRLKKETFFEFMLPLVRRANDQIRNKRRKLERIARKKQAQAALSEDDLSMLNDMSVRYRLKMNLDDVGAIPELLKRVDTIPASLVLAQSANESAWGTARFARNGNNYFGIWCWARDCGLVPKKRDAGAKHEVAAFKSIVDSVDYYLLTLNSHPAYETVRELRATLKAQDKPVKGWDLAAGLTSYSERREEYVAEIRAMIDVNNLRRFTRVNYDI